MKYIGPTLEQEEYNYLEYSGIDEAMLFDKFNHVKVLPYLLCILLSNVCLSQVTITGTEVKTLCIHNATLSSRIKIDCGNLSRIEVVSIYFDHRQTSVGCYQSVENNQCRKLFTGGDLIRRLFRCSIQWQSCVMSVSELPTTDCTNTTPFNFVLVSYRCVPDTDFVELCGNAEENITTDTHLAYFSKNKDGTFKNCTCSILGPHTLTAVTVGVPLLTGNCKHVSLWINCVHANGNVSNVHVTKPEQLLFKVDFKELQSSRIRLKRECTLLTPPAWFKIKPVKDKTVRIQCEQYIDNSPSSSPLKPSISTTSPTTNTEITGAKTITKEDDHNTTSFPTDKNTKVPVIIGSLIGGLVFIIILTILVVLIYRRKIREKSPSGLHSLGTTVDHTRTNDQVYAQSHQIYANNAYEEVSPGYSSIGETKSILIIKNVLTPAESLNGYGQLQPASVIQTSPHRYKKANDARNDIVPIYDHTKIQTKGGHNALPGSDDKHSTYDVLENKANLNLSFDKAEPLDDDTYNHIRDNHDESNNTVRQLMGKSINEHAIISAPEHATVKKHATE